MNPLSREAIATAPEFTNRTPFALVVDALLVRATDDAIRHRNGQHAVLFHEFQNLPRYAGVAADVAMVDFPVAHLRHLRVLERHDSHSDLRRLAQVRTVERNRRHRPPSHALSGFLAQTLE